MNGNEAPRSELYLQSVRSCAVRPTAHSMLSVLSGLENATKYQFLKND